MDSGDAAVEFDRRLEAEKLAALAEFAAGAGHEINNPLAVISGRAQLLLRDETHPERRRDLALIHAQALRVHEMIADLMLFARPPEPRRQACDLAPAVDRAVASLAALQQQRGATIQVRLANRLPALDADPAQLVVALRAIVQNSLEATPAQQGQVAIGAEEIGDRVPMVAITIHDNGPGMTAEVRRHAFDPYYSGRAAGRGLGNGLSKCWRIVTQHGGDVLVDCPAGGGTTVTLRWPTAPAVNGSA